MEKYVRPEMEVVEFDAEDVIMASGCASDCSCVDPTSSFDGPWICFFD